MARQKNEGEGNRTAAREFNTAQAGYAASGKWKKAGKDAAAALDGPEGTALRAAETSTGKRGAKPRKPPARG
ncbi:MAG: hypothetical protein IPK81_05090 [Rhodospirillales bacterium]|nr:MAG: hypothetical protein IPK81_05090 [Rhodospirillales bacterium]